MSKQTMLAILAVVSASACSSSSKGDRATIGSHEYFVPSGWVSKDFSTHRGARIEWTPGADNERKESITITRVDRPALAKAKGRYLARMLDDAQDGLPGGTFGSPTPLATEAGIDVVMIEGSFTPRGQQQRYHRIHAVLVDGSSIVTVIYTARDPDRDTFEDVIESFNLNRGA